MICRGGKGRCLMQAIVGKGGRSRPGAESHAEAVLRRGGEGGYLGQENERVASSVVDPSVVTLCSPSPGTLESLRMTLTSLHALSRFSLHRHGCRTGCGR